MPALPPPPSLDAVARQRVLARLARADAAPWLHEEVARRMADRLKLFRQTPPSWVDWWAALGGGAAAVVAVLPKAQRQVAEPTDAFLQRSRLLARGRWWSRLGRPSIESLVRLEAEVPAAAAQMVWANMMLHLSPNPPQTMQQWHAALQVGGFLMFSTLGPDTLRELRGLYAGQGWPAPHAPFVDMHDIGDQLVQCGFADPVMDQERIVLTWSSPQALLAELRGLGGNAALDRAPGLRTPRWRERLHEALAARADDQGRIRLGFEVVYGHAFKAPPRPGRGEASVVSLEGLRSRLKREGA